MIGLQNFNVAWRQLMFVFEHWFQWQPMEWTKSKELYPGEDTGGRIDVSRWIATGRGCAEECAKHNQETSHTAWHHNPLTAKKRWTSFHLWTLWFKGNGLQPLVSFWCSRYLERDTLQPYYLMGIFLFTIELGGPIIVVRFLISYIKFI